MKITVTVDIPDKNIEYFNEEFPAYIHYWGTVHYTTDPLTGRDLVEIEEHGGYDNDKPYPRLVLPEDWAARGLQVLASSGYARLGELLEGEYDCESLDCLVQAGLFGEIRYG